MKPELLPNPPFSYTIRRSQRATKARIVVTIDKVEVIAPAKVAEHRIVQFVHEKQQWILLALAKMAEKNRQHQDLAPVSYHEGTSIPFRGSFYQLTIKSSNLKRAKILFSNAFIAHIPSSLPVHEHSNVIKTALISWMKIQTKLHVQQLVEHHRHRKQLVPRSIVIKRQKSRWGSCGIHNDISINWLLVLAPPEILEYVVVHELCHIQVRNHSVHFWSLVAQHLPDYQNQRRWLKQHGAGLMQALQ